MVRVEGVYTYQYLGHHGPFSIFVEWATLAEIWV